MRCAEPPAALPRIAEGQFVAQGHHRVVGSGRLFAVAVSLLLRSLVVYYACGVAALDRRATGKAAVVPRRFSWQICVSPAH